MFETLLHGIRAVSWPSMGHAKLPVLGGPEGPAEGASSLNRFLHAVRAWIPSLELGIPFEEHKQTLVQGDIRLLPERSQEGPK